MSYIRYEELGEVNKVDVNITKLNRIKPQYWSNPLRGIQETIHLNGIQPQKERTKVLLVEKNVNPLLWTTAPDLNKISECRKYW